MIRTPGFSGKTIACLDWLAILDELNIAAFIVGRDRRIEALNLSAQAMIGVPSAATAGRFFWVCPAWFPARSRAWMKRSSRSRCCGLQATAMKAIW